MYKFIIAFILISIASLSYARDRVEQTLALDPEGYCKVVTGLFRDGVVAANMGAARVIKPATQEMIEKAERGERYNPPKDAIYMYNWEVLTQKEAEFASRYILQGWDETKKVIDKFVNQQKQKPENKDFEIIAVLPQDSMDKMVQAYFERCLYDRASLRNNKEADQPGLKKMASSESIKTGSVGATVCDYKTHVAEWIITTVRAEAAIVNREKPLTLESFLETYPMPENWSEEYTAWATNALKEALTEHWMNDPDGYIRYIRLNCLEGLKKQVH